MSNKPNLFIIGAMKSATTSLHSYIGEHPDIFMSDPKEPSYFVEREQLKQVHPQMEERGFWRDKSAYMELFKDAGKSTYLGEGSTSYTKLPVVTDIASQLAQWDPQSRLIYIMRDPIERTMSHYWHNVRWHNENRDIYRAIKEEPFYTQVSNYAMQLKPFFELFPPNNIHTLTYEELKSDPVETLKDIFSWLEVDNSFTPTILQQKYNKTPSEIIIPRGLGLTYKLRHSKLWDIVGPLVPKFIRSKARIISDSKVKRSDVQLDETIQYLREINIPEVEKLEKLLNRQFPQWTTLYS